MRGKKAKSIRKALRTLYKGLRNEFLDVTQAIYRQRANGTRYMESGCGRKRYQDLKKVIKQENRQ